MKKIFFTYFLSIIFLHEGINAYSTNAYSSDAGRKEIAQRDYRDEDIDSRAYRRGNWDFKQNWRYDREDFYSGKTQLEANRDEHPYGKSGIGYDGDPEYNRFQRQN
jgi:hypothetical protein